MNVYAPGWYFIAAIGRIIALALIPKMPMPQTSERSVTSHGRRDFADVIKVKDLKMRRLSWIIQMAQCNHKGP